MNNITISLIFRLLSLIPLSLIFGSIFKTYWEKINTINGLRKTRVVLMILIMALTIDQFIFIYYSIDSLLCKRGYLAPDSFSLIFDKLAVTGSFYLLYYLFRHAANRSNHEPRT